MCMPQGQSLSLDEQAIELLMPQTATFLRLLSHRNRHLVYNTVLVLKLVSRSRRRTLDCFMLLLCLPVVCETVEVTGRMRLYKCCNRMYRLCSMAVTLLAPTVYRFRNRFFFVMALTKISYRRLIAIENCTCSR